MNSKVILFDIGEILLEIDWRQFYINLGLKVPEASFKADLSNVRSEDLFDQFEKGFVENAVFYEELRNHLVKTYSDPKLKNLPDDQVEKAWNSIIVKPVQGVENMISTLAKDFKIYALSNACKPHIEIEALKYPFFKHFTKVYASYAVGLRKPDPKIYEYVIKAIGSAPKDIIFFDDREENVAAAKACGLDAHLCCRSVDFILNTVSAKLRGH